MNWKRRVAGLMAAVLMGLGIVAVQATPAMAVPGCGSQVVCIFEHQYYGGQVWVYGSTTLSCQWVGAAVVNRASSLYNTHAEYGVTFFDNGNCTGSWVKLNKGGTLGDHIAGLHAHPYYFGDRIESFRLWIP